jgi:hypothetical protein
VDDAMEESLANMGAKLSLSRPSIIYYVGPSFDEELESNTEPSPVNESILFSIQRLVDDQTNTKFFDEAHELVAVKGRFL